MAFFWTSSDVITLLAWLDFCIENGVRFDETILDRLRENRKRDTGEEKNFTITQVTNKLVGGLARACPEHPRLREIRAKGSVCFTALDNQTRQDIKTQLANFRQEFVYLILRKPPHQHQQLETSAPGVDKGSRTGKSVLKELSSNSNDSGRISSEATSSQGLASSSFQASCVSPFNHSLVVYPTFVRI